MDHPPTAAAPRATAVPDRRGARPGGVESTPLLLPPADGAGGGWASALAGRRTPRSAASTPRGGGDWDRDAGFLSRSPMVSGRAVALPDLRLRELEAERRRLGRLALSPSSLAGGGRGSGRHGADADAAGGRPRSTSLGGSPLKKGTPLAVNGGVSLGDDLLRRRTPSGLRLLDLEGAIDGDGEEGGDGAIAARDRMRFGTPDDGAEAAWHTETGEEEQGGGLRMSQSCTMAKFGPNGDASPSIAKDADSPDEGEEETTTPPGMSVLYALVNASIVLPVLMSFGAIIYRDDFFRPHVSVLMKLTVVSGAVHQLCFSAMSSLPFAVGQVQDAGLIFLSAIAGDIVRRLGGEDGEGRRHGDDEILATVTVGLSLSTALLGCALVAVGRLGLASYCQLLPSSVVGGYLAYIGLFCGQGGLSLMARADATGPAPGWGRLAGGWRAAALAAPGLAGGAGIYWSCRRFRHMAVLPGCIVLLMVGFYAILWLTGSTIEDATRAGWVNESVESPSWSHTWDFIRIDKVVWSVLPSQALTLLAMISVVALSSSLDIAAIEIELKRPLDYNHELRTVGWSNVISGLLGGYTGSYIFSQTIFSLRMGIRSRLMGYILALTAIITVVVPFNILAYIPNFFFGSLLVMICVDLLSEWLIDVRSRVSPPEYAVVISTFALLQVLGVEFGIIAGVLLDWLVMRCCQRSRSDLAG